MDVANNAAVGENLTKSRKENEEALQILFQIWADQEVDSAFDRRIIAEERERQLLMEEAQVVCGRLGLVCMVNFLPVACQRVIDQLVLTREDGHMQTMLARMILRLDHKVRIWIIQYLVNQTLILED